MNSIKFFRIKQKITLSKLAQKTNLSIGYLSHLENGSRNNPSYKTMLKISQALNKNIGEIFNWNLLFC